MVDNIPLVEEPSKYKLWRVVIMRIVKATWRQLGALTRNRMDHHPAPGPPHCACHGWRTACACAHCSACRSPHVHSEQLHLEPDCGPASMQGPFFTPRQPRTYARKLHPVPL